MSRQRERTPDERSPEPIPRLSLRAAEAAIALGISERKLWELTNAGRIPHVKLDSIVLYLVDTLRQWLVEQGTDLGYREKSPSRNRSIE